MDLFGQILLMLITKPLPFIRTFIGTLDEALAEYQSGYKLSFIQRSWLSFCMMGIIITNSVNWAKFERASLGRYPLAALSWVFRRSKIPWELLLQMSVR